MGAPCTSRMCNCRLNQRSRPSRRETTPHSRRETQCLRVVSTCETLVWPDLCPCPPSHGIPRHLTISHPHLIVQREEHPNESRSSTQLGTRFDFPENLLPLPSCFHRKIARKPPRGSPVYTGDCPKRCGSRILRSPWQGARSSHGSLQIGAGVVRAEKEGTRL